MRTDVTTSVGLDAHKNLLTCLILRINGCENFRDDTPALSIASGPSTLNEDQIAERGARMARRDDRGYREYLREEQRRQAGCPAREVVLDQRGQATSPKRPAHPARSDGSAAAGRAARDFRRRRESRERRSA